MSDDSRTVLEIDRDSVARYFYWVRLWFLLPKFGWRFANEQANRLQYWIENDTLRVDEGLWWLQRKTIPLARITDTNLVQGPLERSFDIWCLCIHTAGQGTYRPEAVLRGLATPESTRDYLSGAIKKAVKHSRS